MGTPKTPQCHCHSIYHRWTVLFSLTCVRFSNIFRRCHIRCIVSGSLNLCTLQSHTYYQACQFCSQAKILQTNHDKPQYALPLNTTNNPKFEDHFCRQRQFVNYALELHSIFAAENSFFFRFFASLLKWKWENKRKNKVMSMKKMEQTHRIHRAWLWSTKKNIVELIKQNEFSARIHSHTTWTTSSEIKEEKKKMPIYTRTIYI